MRLRDFSAETIAIRLPTWVGDAVMATPALRALRRELPGAKLVGVGSAPIGRLLGGLSFLDAFLPTPRRRKGLPGLSDFLANARQVRSSAARVGLVLPHSFSSAALLRLAGVRRLVGYHTRERGFLLSVAVPPVRSGGRRVPEPMTRHYLRLLAAVGVPPAGEHLELAVSEAEEQAARDAARALGLAPGEAYCAVNPGASFGSSKFWTVEGFARTIQELEARHGLRTLVLCGPGEERLATDVARAAGPAAVNSAAQPLPLELLKPVLRDARLLVTTDTGPRHVATAFAVPTVVLMGPTDPRYTASNLEWTEVLRIDVDCGPCHLKVCPLDHRCMTGLGAEAAVAACEKLLDRARREGAGVRS